MFLPVSLFIGFRYSRSQKNSGFISFITFFSIAGILLGVASLITVVSVMNGFEGELKKRILGLVPHVIVEKTKDSQSNFQQLGQQWLTDPQVANVTPFVESEALIQSKSGLQGILIQGVSPELEQENQVASQMIAGSLSSLVAGEYQVVIGRALAYKLNINLGDTIRLVLPNQSLYTPMGRIPMQRNFVVSGMFHLGSQVDDAVVYVHYQDARKLMRVKSPQVDKFRVSLKDAFLANDWVSQNSENLQGTKITTWQQSQGALFAAVSMEKNMMWLMLSLIVAVAAFNIVSALVMVVNDKQGEIGILQTLGMSRVGIVKIFITQGMINGCWGVAIGSVLGIALTFGLNPILDLLGLNVFGVGYDSQQLPIRVNWLDISVIIISAFLMSFLATLYPAYRASQTLPAEVLRNE